MRIVLGSTPDSLDVIVAEDNPFYVLIKANAGGAVVEWPAGTTVKLEFGSIVWDAILGSGVILFDEKPDAVNALIASGTKSAELVITQDDDRIPWARGRLIVR